MAWEQLKSILDEMREAGAEEANRVPVACPRDGQPLNAGRGEAQLHCPFCGFTYP
jgi:hypothetical protein